MLMWLKILSDILIAVGAFFALVGVIGILRMPDAFCRMQASTCVATLGVLGVTLGGLIHAIFVMGSGSAAVKIAVIGLLILVTNPIGSHSIAKGAYKAGIRPEKTMEIDDLGRDSE
ncbi:MAG: monovalent cation/H(+) antiporter subunit G [Oscillospiraceae bacterium]|nr:monovalent cation/H(+) antiporter subunit G [Oscillospiraceae bacterium]